jgi:hypothetical protein
MCFGDGVRQQVDNKLEMETDSNQDVRGIPKSAIGQKKKIQVTEKNPLYSVYRYEYRKSEKGNRG